MTLPKEVIDAAVIKSFLDGLTPEIKASLIQQAIEKMLVPEQPRYSGHKPEAPLTEAFQNAVFATMREVVMEQVKSSEVMRARLQELFTVAAHKMLNCDTDKMAERMSEAFIQSLRH